MLMILPAFFISSCEKLPEIEQFGSLEIGLILDQPEGELKSALEDSIIFKTHYVVVSILNEHGELVMDGERIELYNFGGYWVTKEIKLKVGLYELIKFFVVDATGNVRLAAPLKDSPKAYLVNHPLPLSFGIRKDQVTKVVPEVLAVVEDPPEAFGYVTFSYSVVKTLNFFIAVYLDDPIIMSPTRYTDAKLTVVVDSLWMHAFRLEPVVNRITVRDGYKWYLLIVEKEGFLPVKLELTRDELLKTSPDNPLLIGLPVDDLHLLVLQPGPADGKDAMISRSLPEENFGDYPFFEALAIQPWSSDIQNQLTRSLIEWDLNKLPKSATIKKAVMTLFYHDEYIRDSILTDPSLNNHPWWCDSCIIPEEYPCAVLQRIISPWEEYEVTWVKQPETTTENQVFIPMKYYIQELASANCIVPPVSEVIDVTRLLADMKSAGHNGMMLRLVREEYPQWFRYASSDAEPPKLWPKLEIYYTLPE
ncbi:MAG: hypothetical protein AMS27_14870 [Bacteroides sp. SM23_62_1]|nr:MAG: hypothetical protein AMS27_14870 [Bacteroides sp. SM23_62_1]